MTRPVWIFTDSLFHKHDTGMHPECVERLVRMEHALRESSDLSNRLDWREAKPASDEELLRCHSKRHVQRVDATAGMSGQIDADTIYSPETSRAARLAAGTVKEAAEMLYRGGEAAAGTAFCLVRPPGHHATRDRAMGFCFFNSVAVAALHLQSLGAKRILIIDWDVHHGNGTQDIFYDDPTVFYYSLHAHPHYPGTGLSQETGRGDGTGTTLNRPLPHGFPADRYRNLFRDDLKSILGHFNADFVIISCGFDSHLHDPLGGLRLEKEDFVELTKMVLDAMPKGRVLSALEGGYNLDTLGEIAVQHVKALVTGAKTS